VSRTPVLVRDAVEDDAPTLCRLWADLFLRTGAEEVGGSVESMAVEAIERMRGEELHRILVAEVDHNPRYPYKPPLPLTVMVNPVVEPLGPETIPIIEGCLSVPGLRGELDRDAAIRVRYLDRDGAPREDTFEGLTAGTFQHEVDHLDGILFLDRVNDPRTFMTWEQFDRHHRDAWLARIGVR
jgi:peptide deformylase